VTVQIALTQAQAGDTIEVSPGTYVENVVIDKAVTIRGRGGLVVLRPARDNEPVLLVQINSGSTILENLLICGNTKVFNQQQLGISIAQGRAEIKHCRFERWSSLHWDIPREETPDPDGDLGYWENYENSCGLHINGKGQEVILEECQFFDCDDGMEIVDGSKVQIVRCHFEEIQGTALFVNNSDLEMYGNSFISTRFVLTFGQGTHIESDHDTFAIAESLAYFGIADSDGTVITFSHATILCKRLPVYFAVVGESLVHPPSTDEKWILMKPKLIFLDSIIELEDDEPPVYVTPSARNGGDPDVYIWDTVDFIGPNLLFIKSRSNQIDPKLGPIEEGRLTLQLNSPALNAASDGTHLGAWQGIAR
jgi:hypothetical protein